MATSSPQLGGAAPLLQLGGVPPTLQLSVGPPPTPWLSVRATISHFETEAPWACGGIDRPDDLGITFGVLLPFSSRGVHIHSQIALVSHSVESKNSDSLPSFCLAFSVPFRSNWQGPCWFNPLFLASAEMTN